MRDKAAKHPHVVPRASLREHGDGTHGGWLDGHLPRGVAREALGSSLDLRVAVSVVARSRIGDAEPEQQEQGLVQQSLPDELIGRDVELQPSIAPSLTSRAEPANAAVHRRHPTMRTLGLLAILALLPSCGESAPDATPASQPIPPAAAPPAPGPGLLVVQAWFKTVGGKPKPQPAKLLLVRPDAADNWSVEEVLDADSNVFHKAIWWRDGILTIGAMKAQLKHWTRNGDTWEPALLWEQSWGGTFDRLRDIEIGDVDGDGADELVIATHDMGVVAVGDEVDGKWEFTEFGRKPDTFVHEIELGDVDGDGTIDAFATPSARNRASMESQPGGVARVVRSADGTFSLEEIVHWEESHAKEILVADLDGDGTSALYAVREAHTEKGEGGVRVVDPVRIVQLKPESDGWSQTVVATLDDQQCRFLLPVDVDGDGKRELVAAGFKNGLYLLTGKPDGTFDVSTIDADSAGYEHATHAADLDGDGRAELYVASDNQRELRRYTFVDGKWEKKVLAPIGAKHITWNIQDGVF